MRTRRQKSTDPAPPKKRLVSRSPPHTRKKITTTFKLAGKKPAARVDPSLTSPPSSQASLKGSLMVSQAHSFMFFTNKTPKQVVDLNSKDFRSERKVIPLCLLLMVLINY